MLLVTGGAGFIGSNFITEWFRSHDESILTLDALTYAGNKANLRDVEHDPRHRFVEGNILDEALVADLFDRFRPRAVVHFDAESHVDRSISGPQVFVDTNVRGTTVLLGVAHRYWLTLDDEEKAAFRFINISTDEVYGSMTVDTPPNTEAKQSVLREQGGGRPVRTRLLQNLRPARRHGEMHQQLRSQTVPGKTSALHADARSSGQDAPRLRRRRADPRLDPCTRLLSSTANDSGKGGTGRHIQRRRLQ